jgi:hypothetical protein
MNRLEQFGRFWFDFVVGDDPILAIGVVASILVAIGLHEAGINGWWAICLGVAATLTASLYRATRVR